MASSRRCPVPFYADPGQPAGPLPGQKIYLVCSQNVQFPGAYTSWPSANAQYTSVSNVTVKAYRTWPPLESAWLAACDRGEHCHGPLPGPVPCSTGTIMRAPPSVVYPSPPRSPLPAEPSLRLQSTSGLLSPAQGPATPPATPPVAVTSSLSTHLSSSPTRGRRALNAIPGKMAYAVKNNDQGVVFTDYGRAREMYHTLQAAGEAPSLASCPSLTEGVSFVEGFVTAGVSVEAVARRKWIREERGARDHHVEESWTEALDSWRMNRQGVWTSDSDESDSASESSLSTAVGD
ncbi:hypothetical protein DFH09DRAFT_1302430 [Mycena vulgaris]|nr:hypothetical protein DFH09DRAFT_1302430 [Mycena vulgaris]